MLARVLIQAWTKPRVAETSQQRRNRRESTQESSNRPRPNLARRRILRCRLSIATPLLLGLAGESRRPGLAAFAALASFVLFGLRPTLVFAAVLEGVVLVPG